MTAYEEKLKLFALDLFKVDAIKFGEYKTKVGLMTPVYCDLRIIISFPKLLETLAELIVEYMKKLQTFDIVCGVPYTALPIATAVSLKTNLPMVMRRKEAKDYGTRKMVEGKFAKGDHCLIVEDVVTSGGSILEVVKDLKDCGIQCKDAIVILNREQGGDALLRSNGIKMHALLSLTELISHLKEANLIDSEVVDKVRSYLETTQVSTMPKNIKRIKLSYEARAESAKNPIAAKLFRLMEKKRSNLCVAADVTTTTDLLNLAEQVGPHICLLKTHIDILQGFHPNFIKHLKEIADRHDFILFEDRKFADIGKVVQLQYSKGIYKTSTWAPVVTAHSLTGNGVLDGIEASEGVEERGVFLLAETSAANSLIGSDYTKKTIELALKYPKLITGIVCQSPLFLDNVGLIQLTPGCQLGATSDNLSQQYQSPDNVILERGADIAVVGRGVTQASDTATAAENYKELLWKAYKKRIGA